MRLLIGLLFGTAAIAQTTGVPYSAEQVTEHTQTLADGTHITQSPPPVKFYQDSMGRTRTETTYPQIPGASQVSHGPDVIDIYDPVAGVHYSLSARDHKAHKSSVPVRHPTPQIPPPSGAMPAARRASVAGPPPDNRPRPETTRESLGTQMIEGVSAAGMRMTTTYPAGLIGNDRPITSVVETWISAELHNKVILTKRSDPRSGESTVKLVNISRAEPDLSLFQVPPDYQVVDAQIAEP